MGQKRNGIIVSYDAVENFVYANVNIIEIMSKVMLFTQLAEQCANLASMFKQRARTLRNRMILMASNTHTHTPIHSWTRQLSGAKKRVKVESEREEL